MLTWSKFNTSVIATCLIAAVFFPQPNNAQDLETGQKQNIDQRLDVGSADGVATSRIEFEGLVKTQNKYSVEVVVNEKQYNVSISKDTKIVLKCSNPRIDFERSIVSISVAGAEKIYKDYPFKSPLYIKASFAHRNQFNRIMAMDKKRLGSYQISPRKFEQPTGKGTFFLIGELQASASNRLHKLKGEKKIHNVLLGKNGRCQGYSPVHLLAKETRVQVVGVVKNDHVTASEILFWPTVTKDGSTDSVDNGQ